MPRVDTSKLLPIEQAPKDGTWIWAYWPALWKRGTPPKPEQIIVCQEVMLPARWGKPLMGESVEHWMTGDRWTPGDDPTHFFPMTQPPMIEE